MLADVCPDEVEVLEGVYEPREDTYLTCICIEYVYRVIISRLVKRSHVRAVEVGSGSGALSIKSILVGTEVGINQHIIAIDIDYTACRNTLLNIQRRNMSRHVDVICCDAVSCLRDSLHIDVLISNPPYLPEDGTCNDIRICAGPDGRLVIDKIVREFLKRDVTMLILTQSSLSDHEKTLRTLQCHPEIDVIMTGLLHILFEDIVTFLALRYLTRRKV
ncbi:MAG: methyltransferase [Crenarchaeota archaeon]|nr:methyltransferase [Thermoproteota archaeon]